MQCSNILFFILSSHRMYFYTCAQRLVWQLIRKFYQTLDIFQPLSNAGSTSCSNWYPQRLGIRVHVRLSLSPSPAPPSTLALGPLVLQWRALFKMMYGKNFDKCTKMSHEFVVQTKRDCCCPRFWCCCCCCCCLFCLVSLFAVDFFMYSQASSSLQLLLLFFLLSIAQTSSESGDETICFAAYTCFPCTSIAKSRGKRKISLNSTTRRQHLSSATYLTRFEMNRGWN